MCTCTEHVSLRRTLIAESDPAVHRHCQQQPLIKRNDTIFFNEPWQSAAPIYLMSSTSSPTMSNCDPSRWKDSNDSSSEPSICHCQSQLKHYDMNGNAREDLRDACKRSMGISVENVPKSKGNRELNHLFGS